MSTPENEVNETVKQDTPDPKVTETQQTTPEPTASEPEILNAKVSAKEEKEEDKKQAQESDAPKPKPEGQGQDKKKEKKDPMMELVDELNDFVQQTNKQITDFIKEKGQGAWNELQKTESMQNLNKSLDQAKSFLKEKAEGKWDELSETAVGQKVGEVKDFLSGAKDTVKNSFANLASSAVNKLAQSISNTFSDKPGEDLPKVEEDTPKNDKVTDTPDPEKEELVSQTVEEDQPDEEMEQSATLTEGPDTQEADNQSLFTQAFGDMDVDGVINDFNNKNSPQPSKEETLDHEATQTVGNQM